MKKGWQTKKLRQVCELVNGRAYSKPELLAAGKYRVLRVGNFFTNYHWYYSDMELDEKKYCDTGDLLYAWSASFGPRMWTGGKVIYHYHIWKVVHDCTQIDQKFLFYFFQWDTEKIKEDQGTGTTMMHVSMGSMNERDIHLPPLAGQQRIVGILDEAFEGIATAKANAEKNLQNARALFESHLQSVFTQRGQGWKMEKLDDLTELARGHNPPKSKFIYEQKPGYVRFYQIRDGGTDDYACYVPDSPQLHKMKQDDIMMVAYRHVGRAFRGVEGAFNVALCKISNIRRDILDDDYLFHLIPSRFVKGELLKRSERSLIPSMSIEHLRELRIPLPPLQEQQHIVKLINSLSEETQRLATLYERKLAALEALKKSLLHQAFTGAL